MKPQISLRLWTNRLLADRGADIVRLCQSLDGGIWSPEKCDNVEPLAKSMSEISAVLTGFSQDRPAGSGAIYNYLFLRRRKPAFTLMATAARLRRPALNSVYLQFEAKPLETNDGRVRIQEIFERMIQSTDSLCGTVTYSGQAHKRIAQRTPLERLEKISWMNFFGAAYLDMFGRDKILQSPGSVVSAFNSGLILRVNGDFWDPGVTESVAPFLAIESHLGEDAFAGYGYPEEPCRVPNFDLTEVTLSPP